MLSAFFAVLLAAQVSSGDSAAPRATDSTTAAAAADLKLDVTRLIRQLGAEELSKRADAEEKLLALGPKILELLPKAAENSTGADAQKRDAIERVRQKLLKQVAEQAVAGSTVTLKVSERPVSEILAEITRQTGNKFIDVRKRMGQQETDPKISVDFEKTPFWQAVDKTLDEAKLGVYAFAASDAIGIVTPGKHGLRSGQVAYTGPIRIEATRMSATRDLTNLADQGSLRLSLEIAWEPRLRPISLTQPLADLQGADDKGQPLGFAGAQGELQREIDAAGTAAEFVVPLVNPPRSSQAIASLSGTLQALLPGKIETFEFSDLEKAKKVEQQKAGVTVTLDEVHSNGDAWEVRVRVHFEKADKAFDSFRNWAFNNEAYIVDSSGKRLDHSGLETTKQTENELGVAYLFDLPDGPKGMKFVYKTPALIDSVPLKYELKNLPLP